MATPSSGGCHGRSAAQPAKPWYHICDTMPALECLGNGLTVLPGPAGRDEARVA